MRMESVRVWSVDDGTALTIFEGHRGGINHLYITPDGSTIVSGQTSTLAIVSSTSVRNVSADALIALWDVSPPRFRRFLGR